MIQLAINGAAGRMGRRLIALGSEDAQLNLICAAEHANHPDVGKDSGVLAGISSLNLPITGELQSESAVVIDFSSPEGAAVATKFCAENQVALVMASTGLSEQTIDAIKVAAEKIPVCWSPNMSLAVNLTMKLVQTAASALKNHASGVDVEILETHHRYKADSPSGTALKFGDVVTQAMGELNATHGREGAVGQRPRNEIGYHAIRSGDDPGQHTILFGMLGEKIELTVAASNRDCYALGALEAAKFIADKPPGLYTMNDVLGL
jgi:4-hydroxy-tetrahydrodipicolinate reductase